MLKPNIITMAKYMPTVKKENVKIVFIVVENAVSSIFKTRKKEKELIPAAEKTMQLMAVQGAKEIGKMLYNNYMG